MGEGGEWLVETFAKDEVGEIGREGRKRLVEVATQFKIGNGGREVVEGAVEATAEAECCRDPMKCTIFVATKGEGAKGVREVIHL